MVSASAPVIGCRGSCLEESGVRSLSRVVRAINQRRSLDHAIRPRQHIRRNRQADLLRGV
jgi:hypothetical protein